MAATRYQAFVQVQGEGLPRMRECTSRGWADDALFDLARDVEPLHAWIQVVDADGLLIDSVELY